MFRNIYVGREAPCCLPATHPTARHAFPAPLCFLVAHRLVPQYVCQAAERRFMVRRALPLHPFDFLVLFPFGTSFSSSFCGGPSWVSVV